MNSTEKRMYDLVVKLRDEYGLEALKAEFEAEGTRTDELLRLLEVARKANVKVALKIGGCEAVRDLLESKNFGCDYIIGPMIETPYALEKFILAKEKVYGSVDESDCEFLFNLETITAYDNRIQMLELAADKLDGCVFGRVDFVGSMGRSRSDVNTDDITSRVKSIGQLCKENRLELVVGGGISMDAVPALREMAKVYLTRFETRKMVFSHTALGVDGIEGALVSAVEFELCWLRNKRESYGAIFREDDGRIKMLEARWKSLIDE